VTTPNPALRDFEAACRSFRARLANVETILHNEGFHAASADVANLRNIVDQSGNLIVETHYQS